MKRWTQSWINLNDEIKLIKNATKRNIVGFKWIADAQVYIFQREIYIYTHKTYDRIAKRFTTQSSSKGRAVKLFERFLMLKSYQFLKLFYAYLGRRQAYFSEGPPERG